MLLRDLKQLKQPSGTPVSLAVSQHGALYAGWSTGAIMTLPCDSSDLQVYVNGSSCRALAVELRTPRSEFKFAHPIAIDAWGSNHTQYVGDSSLNRVFEISDDFVSVVAGTGAKGEHDGDGLTEATFESIRSVAVLSKYIAVLSMHSDRPIRWQCSSAIRLIHRATLRVTTLTTPSFPFPFDGVFQLLNTSQSSNPNIVLLADAWRTHRYPIMPNMKHSDSSKICIFRSATKTIEIVQGNGLVLNSSLDHSLLEPQRIPAGHCFQGFLPVYCPLSDSLFMDNKGVLCSCQNFLGRKEEPFPIELDVSTLLASCGLTHDLEITHYESNTTFRLFRSIIECHRIGTSMASERLALFFWHSKQLPAVTITRFIEHLYFKPLVGVDSQQLIALAWIYKEVFGQEDPTIIKALQDSIKTEPDAAVFDLLISSWKNVFGPFELDETSLVVATLLPRVQLNRPGFKLAIEAVISKNASNLQHVLSRMMSLFMLVAGPPLIAEFPLVKSFLQPLSPITIGPDPSHFLSVCSTNFVINPSPDSSIGVCGWLLYVHWPWFKTLVDSGLQESKTRIINLPPHSFNAPTWKLVLTTLQFGCRDPLHRLSREDAISVLEHASKFGLVDFNDKPLPRIAPLINFCETKVFPRLSPITCWDQLQAAHYLGSPKYSDIFQFIIETVKAVPMIELANLSEEVGVDLLRKLKVTKRFHRCIPSLPTASGDVTT